MTASFLDLFAVVLLIGIAIKLDQVIKLLAKIDATLNPPEPPK